MGESDPYELAVQKYFDSNYVLLDTMNLPKAKGLQIQLKYPESWILEEGDRPNVVQKFRSPDKIGNIGIVLIFEFPKELLEKYQDIGPKEEEEIVRDLDVKEFVPSNSNLIRSVATKFDGQNGYLLEYTSQLERAGQSVAMHTLNYLFIYRKWMASFQCSSGANTIGEASKKMASLKKVCQKIAFSIVVPEKWKTSEVLKQGARIPEKDISELSKPRGISFYGVLVITAYCLPGSLFLFLIAYFSLRKSLFQISPSYKRLFVMFLAAWIASATVHVIFGIETVQSWASGTGGLVVASISAILVIIIGRGKSVVVLPKS